ncbi:MAG: 3-oxoacyl-[acyl-carrier protein] reductase [Bradymonadia bacterium]
MGAGGAVAAPGMQTLPEGIHRHVLNVAEEDSITTFVDWAAAQMGGVTGLINNAGIIRDGLLVRRDRKTGEVKAQSTAELDAVLSVNLRGATLMVREVARHMITQDTPGVIVNMSSISRHGNRGQTAYVAAKAAMAANTVTWGREFARYGIRVGAIAPGLIRTPMTEGMNQKALDAIQARIPLRKMGEPVDIWRAVQFIIECDYFTTRTMDVDGGYSF